MEAFLGENLVCFDGRIVEGFGPRPHGHGRIHIATIDEMLLDRERNGGGYIKIRVVWRTEQLIFPFSAEQLHLAEAFTNEVRKALEALRSG